MSFISYFVIFLLRIPHFIVSKQLLIGCFNRNKATCFWVLVDALRRHIFNTQKFNAHNSYSLFFSQEPFMHTLRAVFKWIHVHLRQLAHVKILLRTNKWPEETHFTKMVCNTPAARFCLFSLNYLIIERISKQSSFFLITKVSRLSKLACRYFVAL